MEQNSEQRQIKKEQVDLWCFESYFQFKVFKITDAAHQVYYMGTPVTHGATKTANTLEELRKLIAAEIPIIKDFLTKTR